jgi:hypothetical protein
MCLNCRASPLSCSHDGSRAGPGKAAGQPAFLKLPPAERVPAPVLKAIAGETRKSTNTSSPLKLSGWRATGCAPNCATITKRRPPRRGPSAIAFEYLRPGVRSRAAPLPRCRLSNFSAPVEKDYFSDGLPSGSPTNWGRSGKLQVAARGSAQRFKAGGNVRRIGRQLHVDLVLEGGVSFEGNRIGVATNV